MRVNCFVSSRHGDDKTSGHRALSDQEHAVRVDVVGQDLVGLVSGQSGVIPGLGHVDCGLGLCQPVRHGGCHASPKSENKDLSM